MPDDSKVCIDQLLTIIASDETRMIHAAPLIAEDRAQGGHRRRRVQGHPRHEHRRQVLRYVRAMLMLNVSSTHNARPALRWLVASCTRV